MRFFIKFSYDGTNYHGWQIQPNANSVQEEINIALSTILNANIQVVGAWLGQNNWQRISGFYR